MFELLHQVRGNAARSLLEVVRKSTREMLDEQEAVRGRLFTIQDVMQSTIRAWLQVCTSYRIRCTISCFLFPVNELAGFECVDFSIYPFYFPLTYCL